MIFVSVGTERFPFDRLIRAVDEAATHLDGESLFVQLGHSTYLPQRCQWTRFLPYRAFVEQLQQARIVVCHAGVGLLLLCARAGKVPLVVPRRRGFGEHVDDHQVELATRMAQVGSALFAEEPEEILPLILGYEQRSVALRSVPCAPPALAEALRECLDRDSVLSSSRQRSVR